MAHMTMRAQSDSGTACAAPFCAATLLIPRVSAEERRGELGRKDADDQPVVVRTREPRNGRGCTVFLSTSQVTLLIRTVTARGRNR